MTMIHTVTAVSGCDNMHLTKTRMISPVVDQAEGSADGMLNSDANFCPVCGSGEMVQLDAIIAQEDVSEDDADLWAVRFV